MANPLFTKTEGGSKKEKNKAESLAESRLSALQAAHQIDPNKTAVVLPDGFVLVVPFNSYATQVD